MLDTCLEANKAVLNVASVWRLKHGERTRYLDCNVLTVKLKYRVQFATEI
jgi:hypothetical protein